MRFAAVNNIPNADVLQWNNSSRLCIRVVRNEIVIDRLPGEIILFTLVRGKLEVVETIVVEDEPSSLPALVPTTLFAKPPFAVRVEEGVH